MAQLVKVIQVFKHADYAVVEWVGKKYTPFVACWCPTVVGLEDTKLTKEMEGLEYPMYWAQGHYFGTEIEAFVYGARKEYEAITRFEETYSMWVDDDLKEEIKELGEYLEKMERLVNLLPNK